MPKQILLVDDSVTIHRVVEITFAQEDYAVTAVKSADEGLERARQLRPDVVLADAGVIGAGKTGYDLCGSLRQDGTLARTACLILTGNFSAYDEGKGTQAGADGFVVKPFETQALIDKVKDAITRRAGGEAAAPRPVAAAPVAAAPKAVGIESLSKPLSTIAAETSAKIAVQPPRPAPMPMPMPMPTPVPVAAAPRPQQPQPKATLMGIPAVNPSAYGVPPAAPTGAPPLRPMPATPSAPIHVEPPRPAPIHVEPPRPAPIHVEPLHPPKPAPQVLRPATLPANVPQMPRPSMVPGVATPAPQARAPEAPAPRAVEHTSPGRPGSGSGIGAVVREAAERAAQAIPAAIAARGSEYEAIAKLSREVIEQVVWEVVPELAEAIIRAELDRLVRERQNA